MHPEILFEDNHCIAIAKPAGLLTQGVPAGLPTLESWVREYLKVKYSKPGRVYLGVPHRLDRPVSGVVVFARNSKAAARLAEQFQTRQVTKIYWAIVGGAVADESGIWCDWLLKQAETAHVECVSEGHPNARDARLEFRVLARGTDSTRLELKPLTGRTHQLRVQTASRGHPILGDRQYGSPVEFGPPAATPRDRAIALHARSLTFLHPIRYEPVVVEAEVPDYWPAI